MADTFTSEEKRRALAIRLRELRTGGFENRPLNRKELGKLLGEAMHRPAGAYAARRVGDFENPRAKSPPPADALRGYAQVFADNGDAEGTNPLEQELLALRDGIDVPPAQAPPAAQSPRSARPWIAVAAGVAVLAIGIAAFVIARSDAPSPPVFCARNTEARPSPGDVAVVCARDVLLRPSPSAPADEAIATVASGDRFTVDRYSPTGAWVHGTAHLDGTDAEGWIEAGWFCPPAGTASSATACAVRPAARS